MQLFAKTLQKYRKERGITQGELAQKLMITPQSVSKWERGEVMPDIAHLYDLATILSVSIDILLSHRPSEGGGYIGIDGGGTKTEFVLIDARGRRINSIVLEGSNPNSCGMDRTLEILRRGIDFLRPNEMNVRGIFFGGAGIGAGNTGDVVCTALEKAYPSIQIGCNNDIYNVIACCSQPDNCIAAISGTGCIVYSSTGGELQSTGGHGYLFDHNGSGFDIGRDAIIAALEDRDGIGPHTLVTELVEEKLGGSLAGNDLYRKNLSYMASFAPLVFRAADQGDETALQIIKRSADHMAHLIRVARGKAPEVGTVILSGSLFARNDRFFGLVTEQLPPDWKVERLTWPPVWGACLQCARMCGLDPLPDVEQFLNRSRPTHGEEEL